MQPQPMNGRSEQEILTRAGLPVELGGAHYALRPLTMLQAEEWESRIRGFVAANFEALSQLDGPDALLGFIHQSVELQLDILYAYDELGGRPALPVRSSITALASRKDIWDALQAIWRHEFPFVSATAGTVGSLLPDTLKTQIIAALMSMAQASPPRLNSSSTNTPRTVTPKRSGRR